jgi:Microtubule binding
VRGRGREERGRGRGERERERGRRERGRRERGREKGEREGEGRRRRERGRRRRERGRRRRERGRKERGKSEGREEGREGEGTQGIILLIFFAAERGEDDPNFLFPPNTDNRALEIGCTSVSTTLLSPSVFFFFLSKTNHLPK